MNRRKFSGEIEQNKKERSEEIVCLNFSENKNNDKGEEEEFVYVDIATENTMVEEQKEASNVQTENVETEQKEDEQNETLLSETTVNQTQASVFDLSSGSDTSNYSTGDSTGCQTEIENVPFIFLRKIFTISLSEISLTHSHVRDIQVQTLHAMHFWQ